MIGMDQATEFQFHAKWSSDPANNHEDRRIEAFAATVTIRKSDGTWSAGRRRDGGGHALEALSESGFFAGWSSAWSTAWGEYETAEAALRAVIESGGEPQ